MNRSLLLSVLVLCGIIVFQYRRSNRLEQERDRFRTNNTALLSEVKRIQADSATMALDVKGLRLTVEEYKRFRAEDAAIIKKLGVKIKHLETVSRHEMEVAGPIDAEVKDTLIIRDTVPFPYQKIEMRTPHIRLTGLIEDNRLKGEIHVPIVLHQAVWIKYKRYWIFWKKPKVVHQTIYSDNPYADIVYSEYIRVE